MERRDEGGTRMEITVVSVVGLVTTILTYFFGWIAKKFDLMETKLLPIQNGLIGIASGFLCYALGLDGMDLATSLITCLTASFAAGGVYDLSKTGNK